MKTPFTADQFFEVFFNYNASVFPAQLLILFFGIAALLLLHSTGRNKQRLIFAILALLWFWTGIVYHFLFFTEINQAAWVFGSLFIIQGLLFTWKAVRPGRIMITYSGLMADKTGYFLLLFGLLLYPSIGLITHPGLNSIISLGLPCPTTIFTFGVLVLGRSKMPSYLLIIPILWSLVGTTAAINFGVIQDYMLLLSAIITAYYFFFKKHK